MNALVVFWGLVELDLQEAIELFLSLEEAESALADVLRDEPAWCDLLVVQRIKLVQLSWN